MGAFTIPIGAITIKMGAVTVSAGSVTIPGAPSTFQREQSLSQGTSSPSEVRRHLSQNGTTLPEEGLRPLQPPARSAPEQLVALRAQISKEGTKSLYRCSADIACAQFRIAVARAPTKRCKITPLTVMPASHHTTASSRTCSHMQRVYCKVKFQIECHFSMLTIRAFNSKTTITAPISRSAVPRTCKSTSCSFADGASKCSFCAVHCPGFDSYSGDNCSGTDSE